MRGLAFGNYSEASPDVHALIKLAADALARRTWRLAGSRSEAEARSFWASSCRRRVGCAVTRAFARYRLKRLPFVGVPRAVLDERARRARTAAPPPGAEANLHRDADLRALYAHQALARVAAD